MSEEQIIGKGEILGLTTEIVSSHVSNNPVAASDLPGNRLQMTTSIVWKMVKS